MPDMDPDYLVADIRDAMLSRMRSYPKPWPSLSEAEQREMAIGIESAAKTLVARACKAIAEKGFPSVTAKLVELKIKGAIEGKISCENIPDVRDALGEQVGQYVIIVMADPEEFELERAPEIDPDQPDLDLDDDDDAPLQIEHQP